MPKQAVSDKVRKDPTDEYFQTWLRERGMRCTGERFAILEAVGNTSGHFTIEEFAASMEANGYHLSLATVYSTFQLLCRSGLMLSHHPEFGGAAVYERAEKAGNHIHLVCKVCGGIQEVSEPEIDAVVNGLRYRRFTPSHYKLYISGLCARCRRRGKRRY